MYGAVQTLEQHARASWHFAPLHIQIGGAAARSKMFSGRDERFSSMMRVASPREVIEVMIDAKRNA